MSEVLKSAQWITGPFSLVAFIVAAILLVYWRSVNTKRGLDFLYRLVQAKVKKDHFYDLARRIISGGFWITALLLILSFGSWVFAKYLESPAQHAGTARIDDADARARSIAKANEIATSPDECTIRLVTRADETIQDVKESERYIAALLQMPSEFRRWDIIPPKEFQQFVLDSDRLNPQGYGYDSPETMDRNAAAQLYFRVGHHHECELHKGLANSTTVIRDVVVSVLNYRTLPPPKGFASPVNDKPIVVVEIRNLGPSKPFPWRFSAKWLLTDPNRVAVDEFATKHIVLDKNEWQPYLIKIAARDSGAYVYTIDFYVQSANDPPKVVPVRSTPFANLYYDLDLDSYASYATLAGKKVAGRAATTKAITEATPP